jgi:glucosyl-dolichyl phosphate glucuronosyltransferase
MGELSAGTGLQISAVICTYNRCDMLGPALDSLLQQSLAESRYEIIVVDNNSTDGTRELIECYMRQSRVPLRHLFEPRQGISHARNAAIGAARAPVIAFTDDDVRADREWLAAILRAFDENPEVVFVGGKVLPAWTADPPPWLTPVHWAPLALADYGSRSCRVDSNNPICLVGANLAFRIGTFELAGKFSPELQRVRDGVGSMEDHEMLLRLLRNGTSGLYDPRIVVTAEVQSDRLTRAYHRKWHTGHGRFYARMRSEEFERSAIGRPLDVPAHLYRQALVDLWSYATTSISGQQDRAFAHELNVRFFLGFLRQRLRDNWRSRRLVERS